jgi:hypothetical protein
LFTRQHPWVTGASLAIVTCWVVAAGAQRPQTTLPLDPPRERGASITPAYEGWYPNPDGSFSMLIGYYNRNTKQVLDIPIGSDNRIEPGGPDRGQPTHFAPRRAWGVFTVIVPADFGDKKITWTLTANGKTTSVPMGLHRDYEVNPFRDADGDIRVRRSSRLLLRGAPSNRCAPSQP